MTPEYRDLPFQCRKLWFMDKNSTVVTAPCPALKRDRAWQELAGINEMMCKHWWYQLLCSCATWLFLMHPLALYAYNHVTTACEDLQCAVFLLGFWNSSAELFLPAPCCEGRPYFQRITFQTVWFFLTFSSSIFTRNTISKCSCALIKPVLAFQV